MNTAPHAAMSIQRRTVLRGLGAALALPCLESLAPRAAWATGTEAAAGPTRLVFIYVPNGVHPPDWRPGTSGSDYTLPYILEPLAAVRPKVSVLSGLTLDKARANGDGGGDHARSLAAFLTARKALKTNGGNIRAGVSVDQLVARQHAGATRFASLELGCERGMNAGNCDSGYSCAYSANMSWRNESMPMAKEVDPKLVFERLFAGTASPEAAAAQRERDAARQSVLDVVLEEANRLRAKVGKRDQNKLDHYMNSVREVELRITRAASEGPGAPAPEGYAPPDGIPKQYGEHARLMFDLMGLALEADLTRVITLVLANEGSNRSYKEIGVPDGHHDLSHHGNDAAKQAKIREINRFHVQKLSAFLEKLEATSDGDGTLLDRSLVLYGSGIGDGNAHNHDHLPILLCGGGNGAVTPGRHIEYAEETPMANLHMAILKTMGVDVAQFGDSTGVLEGLRV